MLAAVFVSLATAPRNCSPPESPLQVPPLPMWTPGAGARRRTHRGRAVDSARGARAALARAAQRPRDRGLPPRPLLRLRPSSGTPAEGRGARGEAPGRWLAGVAARAAAGKSDSRREGPSVTSVTGTPLSRSRLDARRQTNERGGQPTGGPWLVGGSCASSAGSGRLAACIRRHALYVWSVSLACEPDLKLEFGAGQVEPRSTFDSGVVRFATHLLSTGYAVTRRLRRGPAGLRAVRAARPGCAR
jgi:hypothetical protein